ncbi:MAG: filamentous hemagglutinin N-terminal domain-containing protein [Nostocaceae cyanobacterium]|nr:filamentous hemagglutinin N-terminal domain-containing protein [Nostocaceae cyanobacterium]
MRLKPLPVLTINPRVLGLIVALTTISQTSVFAQIVPDTTLGVENSVVTSREGTDAIAGGATRGNNLFHSFEKFSIPTGSTAFFNNAVNIENIITRVTGTSVSQIDGLIRANGTANLFLLNPNGIILSPNATLNIGGSFIATTANSIKFADGSEFSANSSALKPLLTISVPLGLQLGTQQSRIINNAATLRVNPGKNITLLGGSVSNTGQLFAPGGTVTLAAFADGGTANLRTSGGVESFQRQPANLNSNQSPLGTVSVAGTIDAANPLPGQTGGTVQIFGDQVGILDNAVVNVSGDGGGGKVLIGGDYHRRGSMSNAIATYVSPQATILADALTTGNGGQIIVWSNQSTRAYGSFSARGGLQSGNGGLIETSSQNFLDVADIRVNATASNGLAGTWLLDPRNVTLRYNPTANGSFNSSNPNIFTPSGDDAVVDISNIETQLNAGTNVTITTGSTGTQSGNITADGFGITKTTATPVTLTLQAANDIKLQNFGINADDGPLSIVLQADSDNSGTGNITVRNAGIQTRGGSFTATAAGSISLESAGIKNDNPRNSNLPAAPMTMTAPRITLKEAGFNSNTSGTGDGATITIETNSLQVEKAGIDSNTTGIGKAGDVTVRANSIALRGEAGINSNTSGRGNAGRVTINTDSFFIQNISGVGSSAFENSTGNAGIVNITAKTIQMNNRGGISSNTVGEGDAGVITIKTGSLVAENDSGLGTDTGNKKNPNINTTGNAGSIDIIADSIVFRNNSGIGSNSYTAGDAGSITIKTGSFLLENGGLGTDTGVVRPGGNPRGINNTGNAGSIKITADTVVFENGGIASETGGRGSAGLITLQANSLKLRNGSNITTSTLEGSTGNAGRIEVTVNTATFENDRIVEGVNSGLGSGTRGAGKGGIIFLTAKDAVVMRNRGGIGISADKTSTGEAGELFLNANSLFMENVTINTSTNGIGNAGRINIRVNSASLNNSSINSNTSGSGQGGRINFTTDTLNMDNNSRINSNTSAGGNGGEIRVSANSAQLRNNSGVSSETSGTGRGGNIDMTIAQRLNLSDRSIISVSSKPETASDTAGTAGNIKVTAGRISLNNRSEIQGDARSVNGGDMELTVQDLLVLRRQSKISTTAGTAESGGNGGIISINAPFIVSVLSEDNDIRANAFKGNGGRIDITAQGIFGIQFQPQNTPRSDITASSRFGLNGVVVINTPDIDPSRGLLQLPENLADPSNQIAQGCNPKGGGGLSSFVATGRGGLPPSPLEPLTAENVNANWITLDTDRESTSVGKLPPTLEQTNLVEIVEAQGWVVDADGSIVLVAEPSATQLQTSPRLISPASCPLAKSTPNIPLTNIPLK